MNKTGFLFIIFLLLQFTLTTPGISATKSLKAKFNLTLKQAKSGDPKSMFLVARLFENGKGTKKNISKASKWYQRSASQNYPAANARLGKLYLEGIGVKKNTKKAFSLLNLAAIQGIPAAQFNLAILYELGIGTSKDLQEAIKWYDFATKGGYYTAKSKSDHLKKQLGINTRSSTIVDVAASNSTNTDSFNTSSARISDDNVEEQFQENEPDSLTESNFSDEEQISKQGNSASAPLDTAPRAENPDSEEQALLGNTFDREEVEPKNASLEISKMSKDQKLALISDQNIKRTIKTLLDGRWFDKNRPVNFLPSPKATCNIINQSDIKCTSRQLQRHTDKETVYYKTLTKISKFTSKGSFLIQYQNTVVRVVADRVVTEDGVLYQSNIKEGLQQVIHKLTCQYQNISNLVCVKDNSNIYNFKNRAIVEKTQDTSQ
jgi:TPR repeat protein